MESIQVTEQVQIVWNICGGVREYSYITQTSPFPLSPFSPPPPTSPAFPGRDGTFLEGLATTPPPQAKMGGTLVQGLASVNILSYPRVHPQYVPSLLTPPLCPNLQSD